MRVGLAMRPTRVIGAESACATCELFLVMARALGWLAAQHMVVVWSARVDDVSATALGENGAAACEAEVVVHGDIQRELEQGCLLLFAPTKRTVAATDPALAEEIAARRGHGAEVGTWCKKLGVD